MKKFAILFVFALVSFNAFGQRAISFEQSWKSRATRVVIRFSDSTYVPQKYYELVQWLSDENSYRTGASFNGGWEISDYWIFFHVVSIYEVGTVSPLSGGAYYMKQAEEHAEMDAIEVQNAAAAFAQCLDILKRYKVLTGKPLNLSRIENAFSYYDEKYFELKAAEDAKEEAERQAAKKKLDDMERALFF